VNWRRIRDTLKKLGAPTTAEELGLEKEEVLKALEMAATIRPERYTILNKLNLNRENSKTIVEATGII
jgi:glycerol-1-phosphate dehydrogenase [NAD(P)+]